ncbi:sugar phosphate isomerase/epimerase [Candidatus Woesearchaeota archaeon]|nr:sugar phosphate isomerase/epimerase [Candidatus Woesearchaeota archaeon]
MKVGIKVWPDVPLEYVRRIRDHVDFFELYAFPDHGYDDFLGIGRPIIIHNAHSFNKVNFADPAKGKINLASLMWSQHLADRFDSSKIIIHPELAENPACNIDSVRDFVRKHHDRRMMIENMPPAVHGFRHLVNTPEDVESVIRPCRIGFCLDLSHAFEYAHYFGLDVRPFIQRMVDLKPSHFHMTDTKLEKKPIGSYREIHMNFWEGGIDLDMLKGLLPKDAEVTIETPQVFEKQIKEIGFLRS